MRGFFLVLFFLTLSTLAFSTSALASEGKEAIASEKADDPCHDLAALGKPGRGAAEIGRVEEMCRRRAGLAPGERARLDDEIAARVELVKTLIEEERLRRRLDKWREARERLARKIEEIEQELSAAERTEKAAEEELQRLERALEEVKGRLGPPHGSRKSQNEIPL